jgi:hypothetical protein
MVRARMSSLRLLGACVVPLAVPACATVRPAAVAVVPGLTVHLDPPPRPDTIVYQRSITRAGQDSGVGTRTVVLRVIAAARTAPLLEVEQRFPGAGGEIVDTALAELATLRAVAHRSHQPTRTMRFTFAASDAEGTVAVLGAARDSVAHVHQPLGGPIFDSNVIDLVVASLPLREGFTAEVPFFIYERGGRVPMPVAVKERTTVAFARFGLREVWIVTVGVPGAPATVWVDTATHTVLRIRYDIQARALSFTDERVTPLGT